MNLKPGNAVVLICPDSYFSVQRFKERLMETFYLVCYDVVNDRRRNRVAAAETQTWLEFAILCSYLEAQTGQELFQKYSEVLIGVQRLIDHANAFGGHL